MKISRHITLGFEEASKREKFFDLCDGHIDHAIEKHPTFAYLLTSTKDEKVYTACAEKTKSDLAEEVEQGYSCTDTILDAEIYEFLSELARGDLTRAREEAADVVAVLYRALSMLENQIKNETNTP